MWSRGEEHTGRHTREMGVLEVSVCDQAFLIQELRGGRTCPTHSTVLSHSPGRYGPPQPPAERSMFTARKLASSSPIHYFNALSPSRSRDAPSDGEMKTRGGAQPACGYVNKSKVLKMAASSRASARDRDCLGHNSQSNGPRPSQRQSDT